MIRMEQPSFCFNSADVGRPHYSMWKTVVGPDGITPSQLAGVITAASLAALQEFRSSLRNIVINTHGTTGCLWIGGKYKNDGLNRPPLRKEDLGVLGILKPFNVGTIWLVSCDAAGSEFGRSYCQLLADTAGTQVIAADTEQRVTIGQAIQYYAAASGNIDDFEGTVYSFTPGGRTRKGIDPEKDVWTVRESR